jgi:hypothetical protein
VMRSKGVKGKLFMGRPLPALSSGSGQHDDPFQWLSGAIRLRARTTKTAPTEAGVTADAVSVL